MVSSNEEDGVWVDDGARADIWSMDSETGEGAMIRQNAWCGIRVSGSTTSAKCSQAKIKLNGQHGLLAEQGAAVSARLLDIDANTGTGVLATHEGTVVDMFGCTSTGNRVGLAAFCSLIRANNCRVVRFAGRCCMFPLLFASFYLSDLTSAPYVTSYSGPMMRSLV